MFCKICNTQQESRIYVVREMMFGLKDKFKYFKCTECGCLQILQFPDDIGKYYQNNYYSLLPPIKLGIFNRFLLLKKLRNEYAISKNSLLGRLLYIRYPEDRLLALSHIPLNKSMRIIDVGCGNGYLLGLLSVSGFTNLTGIDPYISQEVIQEDRYTIYKKNIEEITGKYDFVMLHHVFEHVATPLQVLQHIRTILSDTGKCMIRIPLSDSYAFEKYETNWVQFDAPRHFFLHTKKSMNLLCTQAGLKIKKIVYDSNAFQFWGSEQYIKDIPLFSDKSLMLGLKNSIFNKKDIKAYGIKAEVLNKEEKGDQAIFILSAN